MKRFLILLVMTGFSLLLLLLLTQDFLLRITFENIFTRMTGFKAKIENFHYQYPGAFHIWGLRLYNPPGFENPVFVECSRMYLVLNLPEWVRRENHHVYLVEVSMREIHLEKTREGILNLDLLKPLSPAAPAKGSKIPFQLDRLRMTLHTVDYVDNSLPAPRKISPNLRVEREDSGPFIDPRDVFGGIAERIITGMDSAAAA